jgi:hypothetical protein
MDMPVLLPKDNITGKESIDRELLESPDWAAAKSQADESAAERIISRLWNPKKTDALKALVGSATNIVLASQPSTSRMNALAWVFAKHLAQEIGAEYCVGDQLYDPIHSQQMKHIPRLQRPLYPREYASIDPEAARFKLGGKTVVVVEDLLTTGGSVKDFVRALSDDGIRVSSVVALAGDRRLQIDEKTGLALKTALHEKGIELQASELVGNLTRSEARGIVLLINNLRTENGKAKLTQNLQRILDRGALEHMGGGEKPERDFGSEREDSRHEPDDKRIQARDILENGQRADLTLQGIQSPQIRVIPDDLASLKAIWQAELDKFLAPIKTRAARLEEKLTAMLVRHGEHIGKHEKAKPKAPAGPLARLSRGKYNKRLAAWEHIHGRLGRREAQLRQRLNWVEEYVREPISEFYQSGAQKYAGKQLTKNQPELVRKLEQARECDLRKRSEQITIVFEKQERTQAQHRGRQR